MSQIPHVEVKLSSPHLVITAASQDCVGDFSLEIFLWQSLLEMLQQKTKITI